MIAKQTLENAARAMGYKIVPNTQTQGVWVRHEDKSHQIWNPLATTTQGKTDLMDLMMAFPLDVSWYHDSVTVRYKRDIIEDVYFINGDKHAALAEAVVSVASQIWESKNG
jgi:hypothetical protein